MYYVFSPKKLISYNSFSCHVWLGLSDDPVARVSRQERWQPGQVQQGIAFAVVHLIHLA